MNQENTSFLHLLHEKMLLGLIEMLILILTAPCCYISHLILMYLREMTHLVSDLSKWFIYALFVGDDVFPDGFCCFVELFLILLV